MPEADVGSYFGKYFLLKKLAAGGMGEVFLAKQQGPAGFEKVLVVKKILPHLTENKEFIELFLSEARLSARMNHRNIVQVFELGDENGTYFIAMEFVQGKALRDILDRAKEKKEKLPPDIARTIAEQICDGSSYAHNLTDVQGRGLNLVHRDLNPQNVLLSYTGDVKIIDFGIAKSEMSTVKTEAGMIKGKFVYMSPEQSLAKKLDKRSDIFAIGITLYEALTGINPFHKNNIVLSLEAVQRFDPPPPSEYDPAYAPFDPILAKALAKDRDKRYSDAAEMQDDLRRIVLPRAQERVGQFISRLFRVELEAEQKVLQETDSSRISDKAKVGRTPARPSPRPATTSPDQPSLAARGQAQDNTDQATAMLAQPTNQVQTGSRKVAATPARSVPAPRPPPRAPPKASPPGNNDTMIDGESPLAKDPALAAAVAKAREQMKGPGKAGPARPDEGEGRTEFLGTKQAPPPPRKPPGAPKADAPRGPTTMEVGPDAAAAAKKDALAKAAAKKEAAHKPSFAKKPTPRRMQLIVGAVCLVAVLAIVGSVYALLSDGPSPTRPNRGKKSAVVEGSTNEDGPKGDSARASDDAKKDDSKKADARDPREELGHDEDKPRRNKPDKSASVASTKSPLGKLTLNAAGAPVSFGGEQKSTPRFDITEQTGTITVGDDSSPFKVTLEYTVQDKEIVFKVDAKPFAIVAVDGPTKGRTPVADIKIEKKLTLLELKKPGQPNGMSIRLRYDGN